MGGTVTARPRPRPQPHELVRQLQFPPGYHFVPTEAELVDVYLRAKIEGRELPLDVVNEIAVLDWQPGSLVEAYRGYGENKWYFFTAREPSSSNKAGEPNRKVRVPGVKATWKATGSLVPISVQGGERQQKEKVVVGTKRVLIYQSSDAEDGKWSMHEYILKGHAKIGQYALCSIQRKQHSDTVDDNAVERSRKDNAVEGSSSSSRKRTRARKNVDPEKTKKKRTTNKAASTKKTASRRKNNKTSARAQEGQHQQEEEAPVSPVKPPWTPPQHQQAPPQALQQGQKALAVYGVPVLTAPPLQGYPPHPAGMLGDYAPMHEQDTRAGSFQCDDDMSQCLEIQNLLMRSCNREEQLPCYASNEINADSNAQYQLYQHQDDCEFFALEDQQMYTAQYLCQGSDLFPSDTTQNHDGQHQIYQQEVGGAFGTPDQHTIAQYYDQLPYELMMSSSYLPAQGGYYCSSDQFIGSVQGDAAASGSDGDMGLAAADDEFDAMRMLRDDDPDEDCVGSQDGSSPEALQSQDPGSRGQQQHSAHGHVCEGPPSRSISDFWTW